MKLSYSELSRIVSHALRHQPENYNLNLDDEGWVSIESLLKALKPLKEEWNDLSITHLEKMISKSEKKRHQIVDGKIRALYGHTISSKINLTSMTPPGILYHGTTPESATIILCEGLKPMARQYVHLAINKEDAERVGKRKSDSPVIFIVNALKALKDGINFYQGNDKVWLSDAIPATYISKV